jgi:ABC-type iron transport system FetAB permease component
MENTFKRLDPVIGRLLFVTPEISLDEAQPGQQPEKMMGYSLAFSAIRCILQYIILPFLLPLIGLAASWALGLTMVINVIAIIALVTSLRRMWRTNYSHRWRYLALAGPAFLILVSFLILDISVLIKS